jgi:hypothetical protein
MSGSGRQLRGHTATGIAALAAHAHALHTAGLHPAVHPFALCPAHVTAGSPFKGGGPPRDREAAGQRRSPLPWAWGQRMGLVSFDSSLLLNARSPIPGPTSCSHISRPCSHTRQDLAGPMAAAAPRQRRRHAMAFVVQVAGLLEYGPRRKILCELNPFFSARLVPKLDGKEVCHRQRAGRAGLS